MNDKSTCTQAINAINNDPQISDYATTPMGKKALQETIRDIERSVISFSDRQAADADALTADLSAKTIQLQGNTARLSELRAEVEASAVLDEDKLDEVFDLENQTEYLAKQVFQAEGRIPAILADLEAPVSALARLEQKYPRIQKSYLARFPAK